MKIRGELWKWNERGTERGHGGEETKEGGHENTTHPSGPNSS